MAKRYAFVSDIRGNVAANASGTYTLRYPASGRLQNAKTIFVENGALATLDAIRTKITEMRWTLPGNNSEVIRRIRPADYLAILAVNGYQNAVGLLPQYFAEPWRALVMDEEMLALEMRRYGQFLDLEIDVTNGANPLVIQKANFEVDDRPSVDDAGKPIGTVMDYTTQTENPGGGNPDILLDPLNGPLQRLYVVTPSTVTLSRVKVKAGVRGETTLYDLTQTALEPGLQFQLKEFGLTIPAAYAVPGGTNANMWPIVFDNNQQLRNDIIPQGVPLRVELFLSAGAQVKIIRETRLSR